MAAGRPLGSDLGMDDSAHLDTASRIHRQANIMINRSAASALGFASPGQAIGQTLSFDSRSGNPFYLTVVGVVDDVRFRSPHEKPKAQFYLEDSLLGHDEDGRLQWHAAIRVAHGDEAATLRRIATVWQTMEPGTPLKADTAPALLDPYYDPDARRGQLFAAGSAFAGLIACLGLYGLAAFNTSRRFKEIGVRKTLGASTADILRLLVGEFLRPVVFANLLAWPVAWLAMRAWLAGFDQRIGLSPAQFLTPALLAIAIAVITVAGQSLRVARTEPATALRYE
jgi:putative ABC transport system permease protein